MKVFTSESIAETGEKITQRFARGVNGTIIIGDYIVTNVFPIPRLVIAGTGHVINALQDAGALRGW